MLTRSIPNNKIKEIAFEMKCHFVISRVDENRDSRTRRRIRIDTRNNNKVEANRLVRLLLYKDHYMIDMNEKLPITKYYIEHKDEIDRKYEKTPITARQLIKNSKGEKSDGT